MGNRLGLKTLGNVYLKCDLLSYINYILQWNENNNRSYILVLHCSEIYWWGNSEKNILNTWHKVL